MYRLLEENKIENQCKTEQYQSSLTASFLQFLRLSLNTCATPGVISADKHHLYRTFHCNCVLF